MARVKKILSNIQLANSLILDSTDGILNVPGVKIDEDGGAACPLAVGEFVASAASGGGFPVTSTNSAAARIYAEVTADLTSAAMVRSILGRMLVTGAITSNAEVFGVVGQLVGKACTLRHDNAGVLGTFEAQTTAVTVDGTGGDNCTAAVMGRVGVTVTATTVSTSGILAGVAAMSNITSGYVTVSGSGILAAFYAGIFSSKQVWNYGLYVAASSATTGICVSTCTTGISLTGTQTTGISIGSGVSTSIAAVTPATFTGVPAANGIIYANTTATSTTPGSVRAILGSATLAATTTSGTIVGVRGIVTGTTAITGTVYAYGVQGKIVLDNVNVTAGSAHVCGLLAQISGNGMTATSGHIAGLIVSGQNLPTSANVNAIYCESGGGKINAVMQSNVKADYFLDINNFESGGCCSATVDVSTSSSSGNIKVLVDGQVRYIKLYSS